MNIFNHPAEKTTYAAGEKAAAKEVVWAKDNIEVLFNNTAELIWAINKERCYLYTNSAYRDAVFAETEITPKEGDHIYLNNEFSNRQIQEWEKFYNRAFKGEVFTARTESIDNKTGQPVYFEVSFNPLCRTKGKVTSIGCFARNITGLVNTEKAIIDQNERLRNIASISSHELRRPVASLLGLINIIDREHFDSPDNKEIIDHLMTVGKEIDDVIRLIINKTFTDDPSVSRYQTP
jgi:hypothetical protein